MKKYGIGCIAICWAFVLAGCDDFLDVMPDNRAELNTVDKITNILVSAYPDNTSLMMEEMASDNALDNGEGFTVESQEHEDAYLWQDITGTGGDSPQAFWNACYRAAAAANQALSAIEELGNPANLQAQRGEALLCRAYAHFALANVFCLPYNPQTAETDLGLPYSEAPETEVAPHYERGNMKTLYKKISDDLEAGLPLINDDIYTVPKYHFNRKAAHAFAARFNLYYHEYGKVIEYADVVLGATPDKMMRNWAGILALPSDWQARANMYISASDPGNLLMLSVYSSWGYWVGPYNLGRRYGHARPIFERETVRATGLWGQGVSLPRALYPAGSVWGYEEKLVVTKIGGYFEYTDKVNGIGYRRNVIVAFSGDETLLCRAEAYALQGDLDKATEDVNVWLASHTNNGTQATKAEILNFYAQIAYTPLQITNNNQRTVKKQLNPRGFTVAGGDQENMIHCLLHLRRVENVHEGLRWQDVKRYGIEIAHNRAGGSDDVLTVDDPRRAMQLPQAVISAGLAKNPR
ncbi:MAG: RagB/SusD family nutrient uptake outer membrane protein [Culturomica sp.]|jgi:hypothetical protein|nr:RagB/SusD family nutrient uptake outer membrane protein [Culturomica sp.]